MIESTQVQETKKPYHTPELQEHGTIQDLTLNTGTGTFDDGGGGAAYSS